MNVVPFGISWNKRLTRIKETVEIARELWSQRIIEYNGQIYGLSNAFIQVFPIDKKVPIYLAANSPKTRELSGTHADGWLAEMMSPERYKTDAQEVFDAARFAGRNPEDIDIVCVITTSVSMDVDKSREIVFQMAKRRFLWWPKQLQKYGYEVTEEFDWNYLTVNKETSELIGRHLEEIPNEACEAVTLYGKPDDCIERIEKYVENGVSHFEFDIPQKYEETCRLIAEKIIPYFKT